MGGLYLFDEPEAALWPTRVLTLLSLVRHAVRSGSQFVIATHSPILPAFPDTAVVVFDGDKLVETPCKDLEHVCETRDLLNAPERYQHYLREPPSEDC